MKNKLLILTILAFSLGSCNPTFQYDVYVKNSTDEEIRVDFGTIFPQDGEKEGSVSLTKGEQKRIISTPNFPVKGDWRTREGHCHLVAEYVNAYRKDSKESNLLWCRNDRSIQFSVVDIGQGEFLIDYKDSDF